MCVTAFCAIYGFSRNRLYYKAKAKVPRMSVTPIFRNTFAWFSAYILDFGQWNPRTGQVHLLSYVPKQTIHASMCDECGDQPVYSQNKFSSFVKQTFPHVHWPRPTRLGWCNKCLQLASTIASGIGFKDRTTKQAKLTAHLEFQRTQREEYYTHIGMARRHPTQYISLIMDGCEAFPLPSSHPFPKSWIRANRFPLHCYCILDHGQKKPFIHLSAGQWAQGPNFVILLLYLHLKSVLEGSASPPRILFLSADNCAQENKNRFLLAFCSLLLKWKLFDEVTLSFLPVGHTHEDVDQIFS